MTKKKGKHPVKETPTPMQAALATCTKARAAFEEATRKLEEVQALVARRFVELQKADAAKTELALAAMMATTGELTA
jgi:multidrug resistance efflux pump